jgi:hypothetical protein
MKIINKSTPFSVCLLRIENAGTLAVESYDDGMKKGNVSFSMAGTPRCGLRSARHGAPAPGHGGSKIPARFFKLE